MVKVRKRPHCKLTSGRGCIVCTRLRMRKVGHITAAALRFFATMMSKERLVVDLKRFLTFLFNKNTGELLGRTCFSWSKSNLTVIT